MKKLLAILLSCLLLATLLPTSYAAEGPLIAPVPSSESSSELPVLDIIGSLDGLTSKKDKATVEIDYTSDTLSFSSAATLKWQGSNSLSYPKKNYTVSFLKEDGKKNKICFLEDWGKQSKYCLKANWIDPSQARNVVSGRIYNQIIHSRNIDDELSSLPNGGVVDGFPVIIKLNGEFLGLYTLNIPKDKWMFGMDDEGRQALLMGDSWSDSVALLEEISDLEDVAASGWELEYSSTEESEEGSAWAAEGMNDFIRFLLENNGDSFRNGIEKFTSVERSIDVLIYTFFIHGMDNQSKNILWASYDGVKWIPSMYDMDGTWGLQWDGAFPYSPDSFPPFGCNLLFKRLLENYYPEIRARYLELRSDTLSLSNIEKQFSSFIDSIPAEIYALEAERWPDVPCRDENNLEQIMEFTREKAAYLDNFFDVSINEDLPLLSTESVLYVGQTVEFRLPERVLQDGNSISWKITGTKDYTVSEDSLTCTAKARHAGKITAEVSLLSSDGSSLTSSLQSVAVSSLPLSLRIAQIRSRIKNIWKMVTG